MLHNKLLDKKSLLRIFIFLAAAALIITFASHNSIFATEEGTSDDAMTTMTDEETGEVKDGDEVDGAVLTTGAEAETMVATKRFPL